MLAQGGNVLRLSGLYDIHRGPHEYWLRRARQGIPVESSGASLLNMLHYEDAASATVKAIKTSEYSSLYLFYCGL